jgi:hypothetical protein
MEKLFFEKENYKIQKKALKYLGINLFKRKDLFFVKYPKVKFSFEIKENEEILINTINNNPFIRDLFKMELN